MKKNGKLKTSEITQLGRPNPKLDTTDIPLKIIDGLSENDIKISNCFLPIQHRSGTFRANSVYVTNFTNDGLSFWTGNVHIRKLMIDHNLPFFYSVKNHSDCAQWLQMDSITFQKNADRVKDVRIHKVELTINGKGGEDKGHIMLTEICIYEGFDLFEKGFTCDSISTLPAFNANNLRNSTLGSPGYPLDSRKISSLPIRIMGKKDNSPKSFGNTIHAYRGLKIELDASAKRGTTVRYYNRGWTKQERIDNWDLFQEAQRLLSENN